MIELPAKFKQALGNGVRTSLYPIVKIYNGVRINDNLEDNTSVINLSIKETNISGESFLPLLLNAPSLTTSADIINNKFTISSVSLSISNSPYNGKIFSDNVQGYLKSVVQVYYTSNGLDKLEDCLLIYSGTIRRFRQTKNTVQLELEDYTEQVLSAKVPSTLVPEDDVQYAEKDIGKPYPAIYGNIEASPLIFNKLDRLEIDKPGQAVEGYWNDGSTVDHGNVDMTTAFVDNNLLRINAYLSVYDKSHLFIPQQGVVGWGTTENALEDKIFYDFEQAHTINGDDIPANIKINRDAYVYTQYSNVSGVKEGFGAVGIPARVYRPLTGAAFFSLASRGSNAGSTKWGYNHFVGFSNNSDIVDNISEEYKGYGEGGGQNSDNDMDDAYEADWGLDNPSMRWWKPTTINDSTTNQDQVSEWAWIDENWRGANMKPEFPIQWVQNGNYNTGIHIESVRHTKPLSGGAFVSFTLADNVGSFPCVTKIYYKQSYFTPYEHTNFDTSTAPKYNCPTCFWVEQALVERAIPSGLDQNYHTTNTGWEYNRDNNSDGIIDDDWITPAYLPNKQHSFDTPVSVGYTDDESYRIDNQHYYNSSHFDRTLKGWGKTTSFNTIQWGAPLANVPGSISLFTTSAHLRELYVIQDILIDNISQRNYFVNVSGRIKDDNTVIRNLEDLMEDLLNNELNFEQTINRNSIHNNWKFDFTLNEQVEIKEVFDGLFKSSLAIPAYNNLGQFKLIPLYQTADNLPYTIVKSIDVIKYTFDLSKLDDVYNQVNVKYKKNYASGKLDEQTGYEIKVGEYPNEFVWQTYDAVTYDNYPNEPEGSDKNYNIDYYGMTNQEAQLEVESEHIRNIETARRLQKRLVSYHANQHLIVKMDLPVSYMGLEAGDYIRFDELLGGSKVFGYDYSKEGFKNGQWIYPLFFITKIKKDITRTQIEAIQVHRGEFGAPLEDEGGNDIVEEGNVYNDPGGNTGQGNFDIPDPFDNPSYSDENINTEENDDYTFSVTSTGQTVINAGAANFVVNTNYPQDWDYEIYLLFVETPDGNPINYIDDQGNQQTLEARIYTEENPTYVDNLFNITKSTSDLQDNYNGILTVNKKYEFFPEGTRVDVGVKIFAPENLFIEYTYFSQLGYFQTFNKGDVNMDNNINVLDIVSMIQYVLYPENSELSDDQIELADMNNDGIVNVQDIIQVIGIILGN